MFPTHAGNQPRALRDPLATHRTRRVVVEVAVAVVVVALFLVLMNPGILVSVADWFGQVLAAN